MWIVYKEANWIQSIIWIILLICFGRYDWHCSFLYRVLLINCIHTLWSMLIQVAVWMKMNLLVYIWFFVVWNLFIICVSALLHARTLFCNFSSYLLKNQYKILYTLFCWGTRKSKHHFGSIYLYIEFLF